MIRIATCGALLYFFLHNPSTASEASNVNAKVPKEHQAFFENEVRPLLDRHCYECHRGDESKGGLRLDSLADILAGGESGAAIEIGNPDASILMEAVRYESYEMPPSGKLADREIAVFEKWIKIGAPWPGTETTGPVRKVEKEQFTAEDREWWAFQPVVDPQVPTIPGSRWARNEIDRFVEA